MSQLEVDKIIPQSGTTLTIGETGDTISFASGVLPALESLTITGDLTVDTNTLFVDSSTNRVGIGTSSPSRKLHISTSEQIISRFTTTNTLGLVSIEDTNTTGENYVSVGSEGNNMFFRAGGSEKLRIDSSGNVGIGTSNPLSKLEISSTGTTRVILRNTNLDNNGEIISINWDDNADFIIQGRDSNAGFKANWYKITSTATDGLADEHVWYTGSSSERMRIDSSGNVGIGTTSPSTKLDVNGIVTATQFVGGGLNAFKNLIINGDMSLAQRGTSETGITGNGYYTVDRMRTLTNLGTWTLSQSTDVPTGQGFSSSFKYDCTTAEAISAGSDRMVFEHRIEGQNVQQLKYGTSSAESLTLSFWVKSNKTGTYCLEFFNQDPATQRQTTQLYTIDSSNTWEKKTITISGDTSQGFTNDNNFSLGIFWWLGAGTDYTSGTRQTTWSDKVDTNRAVGQTVNLADNTANEWYITGVQLEVGTSASDFEFLPYDVNLLRCMRYFERISRDGNRTYAPIGNGMQRITTQSYGNVFCRVLKRASATSVSINNIIITDRKTQDKTATAIGDISTDYQGVHMSFTHDAFGADFRPVLICGHQSTGGYIDIDSEL